MDLTELLSIWYMWLGSLNGTLAEPIRLLSDGLGIPLFSALLFGLLGTTAPCQLSTNFGAVAFLTRQPAARGATWRATLAYIAAKILVYTLGLGAGPQLPLGLHLAPQRGSPATATALGGPEPPHVDSSATVPGGLAAPGVPSSFLLGLAFSCAFCPTLFLLFFGVTLTLAARAGEGVLLPAMFALGTALPLLGLVGLALSSARPPGAFCAACGGPTARSAGWVARS